MSRTPMKLILTQEVSGLGAPGDVVDVASGYGGADSDPWASDGSGGYSDEPPF